jgi:sulfide:quinone oxidoreductase
MERKHIVVLGGSFAGLTAAYEIQRAVAGRHRVSVVDKNDRMMFIPSLIWVPFGWRTPEQISFPLRPSLTAKGIEFLQATVQRIDPERRVLEVVESDGSGKQWEVPYDYLLLATGPQVDFAAVPGLGPHGGYTQSICTAEHALSAGQAWQEFLKQPGPVIVGATQNASCFGAAYEFVFNLEYALRKAGVRERVPITFVTAEPFAGHFGIGGLTGAQPMTEWFFRHSGIDWALDAVLEKVTPGQVHFRQGRLHHAAAGNGAVEDLAGRSLPFRFAMLIPPFLGVEAVRRAGLGNERGFLVVDDYFRHPRYPTIFAAGVSVAVASAATCAAGCSVPKTGYISEVMAKYAARNLVASILGKPLTSKPVTTLDAKCILDAGNQGILMYTDRVYAPRQRMWQMLIPGPWGHWAKVWFEKYFLWKMRTGRVGWP